MSLRDVQSALGTLVVARAAGTPPATDAWPSLDGLSLSAEERTWLEQLVGSPGFKVTCHIQRWWRETRLKYAAPLTLAALSLDQRGEVLRTYLDMVPPPSLFFSPEALGFLDFVIRMAPTGSHLEAIARFERALRIAAEAAILSPGQPPDLAELCPMQTIHQHPAAALVKFTAPPETLLGALLAGQSLPPPDGREYVILVAPGLPYWWRPAAPDEARLFTGCQSPIMVERLLADHVGAEPLLRNLARDGALCVDQK
jgi:hypothetical protein